MKKEKISALVDGELNETDVHAVTQELADPETLARMELYYRIGEELRADSAKANLSQEFPIKLASALAAESPHAAQPGMAVAENRPATPELSKKSEPDPAENSTKRSLKQYIQGLVA